MRTLLAASLCLSLAAAPARAGKLDLDIYARPADIPAARPQVAARTAFALGDPRASRGDGPWTRRVTHAGYTGFALAGLVTSIATGGVAPAVGFGIVALVQGCLFLRSLSSKSSG